jgi:AraC family transcriptional regulator
MCQLPGDRDAFHGFEIELRRLDGMRASRVVHPPSQTIYEHNHDAACLTLHVMGGYTEVHESGEQAIAGPAAVLHPPGRWHANWIAEGGLETVSIVFDPKLLSGRLGSRLLGDGSRAWSWGDGAARARQLATLWTDHRAPEAILVKALGAFLEAEAPGQDLPPAPKWLTQVRSALESASTPSVEALATAVDLDPDRLARGYRAVAGEGLQEAIRRKRVERAALLLRGTAVPLAEIAVEVGFCDQSHMNRVFRAVLGRTPRDVRREADQVRSLPATAEAFR